MAIRILTSEEKELLKSNIDFSRETYWAILRKASYWQGQDGANPPGGDRQRWRKSQTYANQITNNPSLASGQVNIDKFLIYIKDITCVNTTVTTIDQFVAKDVVNYLLDDGTVNHINTFDTLADKWFDATISQSL